MGNSSSSPNDDHYQSNQHNNIQFDSDNSNLQPLATPIRERPASEPVLISSSDFVVHESFYGMDHHAILASSPGANDEEQHPCRNSVNEANSRLDTQLEVKVYPCNNNSNSSSQRKKFMQFLVKPEGIVIQGANSANSHNRNGRNNLDFDLGAEYAKHIGRKLPRYELADTRATQLLVTSHDKSFWVVPSPNEEAFSRHSGTCRLLGDRKHTPTNHTLSVGDFLRVGSVGVVVIEIHDGKHCTTLSEEKIQRITKDTSSNNGPVMFNDVEDTDLDGSDVSCEDNNASDGNQARDKRKGSDAGTADVPFCYMCFDETETETNPLITPCKCKGDTQYVHVECLRKWHSAESDNPICFLSSVDATCSVCKSTFQSNIKLKNGRVFKLFKSCLEPPYVSLLVATKHEMAQRLYNTRFQLSFSTLLRPELRSGVRPLILGRSSGSDMVLDYRTVSARHASIRFKNGEFIFCDAGSSNGSYLYLRKPVELAPNSTQSIQFRIGRSMVSMKVVSKWNRRMMRLVRGRSSGGRSSQSGVDASHVVIGDNEDYHYTVNGVAVSKSTMQPQLTPHEEVLRTLPPVGEMKQSSPDHLSLLHALAYPRSSVIPNRCITTPTKATSLTTMDPGFRAPDTGNGDAILAVEDADMNEVRTLDNALASQMATLNVQDNIERKSSSGNSEEEGEQEEEEKQDLENDYVNEDERDTQTEDVELTNRVPESMSEDNKVIVEETSIEDSPVESPGVDISCKSANSEEIVKESVSGEQPEILSEGGDETTLVFPEERGDAVKDENGTSESEKEDKEDVK